MTVLDLAPLAAIACLAEVERREQEKARFQLNQRERLLRQEFEDWKEKATELVHERANQAGWCSDVDDILEELGLRRRCHQWRVRVVVDLLVDADTAQEAEETIDDQYLRHNAGNAEDWSVDTVEEAE